jgi:hypothetical protein
LLKTTLNLNRTRLTEHIAGEAGTRHAEGALYKEALEEEVFEEHITEQTIQDKRNVTCVEKQDVSLINIPLTNKR